MKRCPNCLRFGIVKNGNIESCIWNDCLWINRYNIDLDTVIYKTNFNKLIDTFKELNS